MISGYIEEMGKKAKEASKKLQAEKAQNLGQEE